MQTENKYKDVGDFLKNATKGEIEELLRKSAEESNRLQRETVVLNTNPYNYFWGR